MTELNLTPQQIVKELDKHIIGQKRAKRAVAIALRNRQRRRKLPPELRAEIRPKNILMIGPTGVGKTEIARRLARLVSAPFIKVEVTKFTEVGYVGRDVESMIKDLVETAVHMVKEEKTAAVQEKAANNAEDRLIRILAGLEKPGRSSGPMGIFEMFAPDKGRPPQAEPVAGVDLAEIRERLRRGELETEMVEIEVAESAPPMVGFLGQSGLEEIGQGLQDFFSSMMPRRMRRRRVPVAEARKILTQQEAEKLVDWEECTRQALVRVEESGVVFLDEIDKICGGGGGKGPDVSREGVQRDILPIVEGCTVWTKYGPVKTDHILFIAAGAFHISKPSDLIPEFQGRFPIRVELEALTAEDFERILVEPENALLKQETALLKSEGVNLHFSPPAIRAMAEIAFQLNKEQENIGARRLYTILEQVLEEISFDAPEYQGRDVEIDEDFVRQRLEKILQYKDLKRYIL